MVGEHDGADLSITTDQLRAWHGKLAKTAARIRTTPGEKQKYKAGEGDPEQARGVFSGDPLDLFKALPLVG